MPTPHIEANKKDVAKIVLMAGDPLRVKNFVENNLKNYKKINNVRGMLGYTGDLNGTEVTVMGHGMGLDSIGIYSYELYKFYDVDLIIRFGSCGSYNKDIKVSDLIVAQTAFTESNYGKAFEYNEPKIKADLGMIDLAKNISLNFKDKNIHFTTVNSSMWFYETRKSPNLSYFVEQGIDVVEMEAYSLYCVSKALNKKAITFLTVSDHLITGESMPSSQREKGFVDMFNFLKQFVTNYNKK